jgi:deoxyribodipyrimidine photolyase-related protein
MISNKTPKTLRLLLGDQLNINHHWFKTIDSSVTYVLMEVQSETNYADHHIQKVLGFFGAMRHFANQLQQLNHQVIYIKLNDANNAQRFDANSGATGTAEYNYGLYATRRDFDYQGRGF